MDSPTTLPETLGPYRILQKLGSGASSTVYLAEEAAPLRRVALKVLRVAAIGPNAQRFRREAELTSALEHPCIARFYAAGVADTAAGPQPWLAMQYVKGRNLTEYVRAAQLDIAARLRLVARIAGAVQHAHNLGVIHRDLKPDNILVDEHGQPMILDFGVARLLAQDDCRLTITGEIVGTLSYMSSEQLFGDLRSLDARTDVYSLGVIAYEIVAGQLPHPGLSRDSLAGAIQRLRREQPPRLGKLVPEARGDVELIVHKAMQQDAAQRYGSAAEFAADIERFLHRRPIEARPLSASYLAQRFVQRHRALSAGLAVAMLALVGATGVSLRYALAEKQALQEAESRLAEREAVNRFLEDMLTHADPEQAMGRQLTVREVLDSARLTLRGAQLAPTVAAMLHRTIGRTYLHLGEVQPARELVERARELLRGQEGADPLAVLQTELDYARVVFDPGAPDTSLKILDALLPQLPAAQGAAQRLRLEALDFRGFALSEAGRMDQAAAALQAAYDEAAATLGANDRQTFNLLSELGEVHQVQGHYDEAAAILERMVAAQVPLLGAEHPDTLSSRSALADVYFQQARFELAEQHYRSVLADKERVLGPEHSSTLFTRVSFIGMLLHLKRYGEAEPMTRDVLEIARRRLGNDHQLTGMATNARAYLLDELDRYDEAKTMYEESIAIAERAFGPGHPEGFPPRNNIAMLLMRAGRLAEADARFEGTVRGAREALGAGHPYVGIFSSNWGECRIRRHDYAGARAILEPALKVLEAAMGPQHERSLQARERLRAAYRGLGMNAEAEALKPAAAGT